MKAKAFIRFQDGVWLGYKSIQSPKPIAMSRSLPWVYCKLIEKLRLRA